MTKLLFIRRLLLATLATTLGALAFTTPVALAAPETPTVISERATFGSGLLDASLEAKINPGEQLTNWHFEYAEHETGGVLEEPKEMPYGVPLPAVSAELTVGPSDIGGGLAANTTYYYRVVASNVSGTTEGPVQHFTTLNQEAPLTKQATSITGVSATLNAILDPHAAGTAVSYFSYYAGYNPPGTPGFPSAPCEGAGEITTTPVAPQTGQGVAVSEPVAGLEGNTEYTFCAFATSSPEATETIAGAAKTFVTGAIAPKVESESASSSTPFEAKLEAQVNPENERSTSCVFEYGKTFVSQHSAPCAPVRVEGSNNATVMASLSGLEAATTYKYRVTVADKAGKTEGTERTFETLVAEKPAIGFGPIASITTPYEATLAAFGVNPGNQETSCVLVYGTEPSLAHPTTIPCKPAELTSEGFVEMTPTGLTPNTTYYFRMILENATSRQEGKPVEGPEAGQLAGELTTAGLVKPVIESESASPSLYEATLEAQVNPEYQETKCEGFEYSAEKAKVEAEAGTKVACNPESLGKGGEGVGVSATISGLKPTKTYYYRVVSVKNASGSEEGAIEHFETPAPAPPVIIREYKENLTPFGATVVGEINPEHEETACYLEYTAAESRPEAEKILEQEKTGTKTPCNPAKLTTQMEAGASPVLKPNTTYYYHIIAENKATEEAHTRAEVAIKSFTTGIAQPPAVEKGHSSGVTALHAKLEAQVNPEDQETKVTFEYSSDGADLTNGTATKIHVADVPAGISGNQPVSADLGEGLTPGETYYYRVVAENETSEAAGEPVEGQTESFTTPSAPVLTTAAAQSVSTSGATLSGTIDPEGAETKYHYAYIAQTLYEKTLEFNGVPREVDPAFNLYAGGISTPEVTIPPGEHTVLVAQPFALTGLVPGTAYVYALVATSTQEVNGQKVTTTVINTSAKPFTVEGTLPPLPPAPPVPEYPNGPLGAPAPVTPVPLIAHPPYTFPAEETGTTPPPTKKLTNAQKLTKALKACHKDKSRHKRISCEHAAHKKYAHSKPKKK